MEKLKEEGKSDFQKELEQLINKHSIENASDTPDFVLAQFLWDCLAAFGQAVNHRDSLRHTNPQKEGGEGEL